MARPASVALLILASWQFTGCTVIRISEADGTVHIERRAGVVTVALETKTQPMFADLRSVGAMSSPAGFSLGYASQQFAFLPTQCHVVVWLDRAMDPAALDAQLGLMSGICSLGGNVQEAKVGQLE